jgi:hypothetical protein
MLRGFGGKGASSAFPSAPSRRRMLRVRRCARQGEDSDCDAYLRRRHSRQRKLLVPYSTRQFAILSREARKLGMVVDHVVPLAPCRDCVAKGDHAPWNWQMLTAKQIFQRVTAASAVGGQKSPARVDSHRGGLKGHFRIAGVDDTSGLHGEHNQQLLDGWSRRFDDPQS